VTPGEAGSPDLGIAHLFLQAGPVVRAVMIGLLLASVISWGIIVQKIFSFRSLRKKIADFESLFWAGDTVEATYETIKNSKLVGTAAVFHAAMTEWLRSSDRMDNFSSDGIKERISRAIDVKLQQETEKMRSRLIFLATIGSAGPFVGLFGTVWGIMTSFEAIAATKTTDLSVVAPGIAEALFATALGLVAAIPSVIGYNALTNQASHLSARLSNFADEFYSVVSRNIDRKGR
jgi:biopolymer transport protein TolQ